MSHVSPALYATLVDSVPDLAVHCRAHWCVIGSAAALLAGAAVEVADVDVLTTREDAETLQAVWADRRVADWVPADGGRFRSRFARYRFAGVPVEVMGGLELMQDGHWQAVDAGRQRLVGVNGLAVPIPQVAEQIRLYESFGRAKDRARLAALKALA